MQKKSSKWVRVLLKGGLGNQLFQYAFGRAISLRSGTKLELDAVTLFKHDKKYKRNFELDAFQLPDEVKILGKTTLINRIPGNAGKLLDRLTCGRFDEIREMPPWRFDKKFGSYKIRRSVKVNGYWQSAQYFADKISTIRSDLVPKQAFHSERGLVSQEIGDGNSVAVHVRRVNYSIRLELVYYRLAVSKILTILPTAKFWIFTDDNGFSEWIGSLGIKPHQIQDVVVDRFDIPSIEDFNLMMLCDHFIIANSTFSWWAAFLGSSVAGIVICPQSGVWPNPDIVPDDWISLPACKEG